jgi:uncharacterized membrane protein
MTITRRRADATVYDDRIITVGNSENFRTSRLHKLSYDIQVVLLLEGNFSFCSGISFSSNRISGQRKLEAC